MRYLLLVLTAAALWVTVSCSRDPRSVAAENMAEGRKLLQAGDDAKAIVYLRNATQADPKSAEAHYLLGKAYLNRQDSGAAFREWTEAVALDPHYHEAQLDLASLLLARRGFEQAGAAIEKVLAGEPRNARAHALLGQKQAMEGNRAGAVSELRLAIELDSANDEYYAALGAILLAGGDVPGAEAVYRQAVTTNPKSVSARVTLAQFLYSQGKIVPAEVELRSAADLDLHAVLPRLLLARVYSETNRAPQAEALYADLKKIAPDDRQAYMALGSYYAETGQREKAAAEFRSLLASRPNDPAVQQRLVEVLTALKKTGEAAAVNLEVLKKNPADPEALVAQGRLLLADGKPQEALTSFQKVVSLDPKSARAHYFTGLAQMALGLTSQARASFNEALKLNPQMSDATSALARLSTDSGDHDAAIRQGSAAAAQDGDSLQAQLATARALIAKGDAGLAEARLESILQRMPDYVPALTLQLNLRMRQGRVQEQIGVLTKLAQQHPESAGLHFLLGLAYYSANDLARAEASVRQALRLDPRTPDAYTLLASIEFSKGAPEQGKANLRQAIAANPQNLTNYLALANQYEKEGNWQEARKLCERARDIDPDSPVVANQLAYLYLESGGDANAALALAQRAKQKLPTSPNVSDTLGWAYYKLGSHGPAISQFKQCLQVSPANPTCHYHLGLVYIAQGEIEAAERSLRRSLQSPEDFPDAPHAKAALDNLSKKRR